MPSPEFRLQILYALGASVLGAFVWDKLCVGVFAPRLLWAGYVDAWRAMPSRDDNVAAFVKVGLSPLLLPQQSTRKTQWSHCLFVCKAQLLCFVSSIPVFSGFPK